MRALARLRGQSGKGFLRISLVKRRKNVQREEKVEYIFNADAKGQTGFLKQESCRVSGR